MWNRILTILFCLLSLSMANDSVLNAFEQPPTEEYSVEDLYGGLSQAETGSFKDPWIRTTAKDTPGGSSAFGPVQITHGKALDYSTRNLLSPESKDFVELFMKPLYEDFLKYGGKDMQPGYEEFDYGKKGYFPDGAKPAYETLAREMITHDYNAAKDSDKPLDEFIRSWRGKDATVDPRYYESVKEFLKGDTNGE